jgi:hypothetical protein
MVAGNVVLGSCVLPEPVAESTMLRSGMPRRGTPWMKPAPPFGTSLIWYFE